MTKALVLFPIIVLTPNPFFRLCNTVAARVASSFNWISERVCAIDGEKAPFWFECTDGQTYSPVPTMSPTTYPFSLMEKPPTTEIAVEIFLDVYADETAWKLTKVSNGRVVSVNYWGSYDHEQKIREVFELEDGSEYEFVIYDEFGDGIINKGGYRIFVVDDTQYQSVGELLVDRDGMFGSEITHRFTVPETVRPILDAVESITTNKNRIGVLRGWGNFIP